MTVLTLAWCLKMGSKLIPKRPHWRLVWTGHKRFQGYRYWCYCTSSYHLPWSNSVLQKFGLANKMSPHQNCSRQLLFKTETLNLFQGIEAVISLLAERDCVICNYTVWHQDPTLTCVCLVRFRSIWMWMSPNRCKGSFTCSESERENNGSFSALFAAFSASGTMEIQNLHINVISPTNNIKIGGDSPPSHSAVSKAILSSMYVAITLTREICWLANVANHFPVM